MSEPLDPTTKLVILTPAEARQHDLEAIRAFVERVEKRWKADDNPFSVLRHMRDELAAMEKEAE